MTDQIPQFTLADIDALREWFIYQIDTQARHTHYKHTVHLARRYKSLFTGDDQTDLIISYKPSETSEQKEQRLRLYNSFTPHICGRIFDTYSAVETTDEIIDKIEFQNSDKDSANKIAKLNAATENFYQESGIKEYLKSNFRRITFYDPNSFIVVEMLDDGLVTKTYPLEVPSHQVFDFEYKNGVLMYLIVELPIKIYERDKVRNGSRFILYTQDHAMELEETFQDVDLLSALQDENIKLERLNKRYIFRYYHTLSGVTQARRVGWIMDPATDFNTCVSPLFKADKLLRDIINTKSEKDLAQALHGFIQKFAYAEVCDFSQKEGQYIEECRGGTLSVSGQLCPSCKGTGKKVHTSVQDIIYIKYPDQSEQRIPLSDFVHYVEIPKHIIEQHNQDLDRLESQVMRAVFNSEAFTRASVTMTATEKIIELSYTYRELSVYANALSAMYRFIVTQSAYVNDVASGLSVLYQFPSNFNLESLGDLLTEREKAVSAQSPYEVVSTIDHKILTRMNIDNPVALAKYAAKDRHRPFRGKSETATAFILASMPPDQIDAVIWKYFDSIFNRIEASKGPSVFNLSYPELQKLIDAEAEAIIAERFKTDDAAANPLRDDQGGN